MCRSIKPLYVTVLQSDMFIKIEAERPFEKSPSGQINSITFNLIFLFLLTKLVLRQIVNVVEFRK